MEAIEWLNSDEGYEWSKRVHKPKFFTLMLIDDVRIGTDASAVILCDEYLALSAPVA